MRNYKYILLLTVIFQLGCPPSESDSSNKKVLPPSFDVTGIWDVTENITSNCPGIQALEQYKMAIMQKNNVLYVDAPDGSFEGLISGNVVSWAGSYDVDSGRVTMDLKATAQSADTVSGSVSWSFSENDQSFFCTGTTNYSATRLNDRNIAEVEPNDTIASVSYAPKKRVYNSTAKGNCTYSDGMDQFVCDDPTDSGDIYSFNIPVQTNPRYFSAQQVIIRVLTDSADAEFKLILYKNGAYFGEVHSADGGGGDIYFEALLDDGIYHATVSPVGVNLLVNYRLYVMNFIFELEN